MPSLILVLTASLAGLFTGVSLIVAIAAQTAYLLRQGLRRAHVGPVVAVCMLSDFALITAGVSGVGAIVQHAGWMLLAVRWLGVAFLTWYGLSSAWRARRPAPGLGGSRASDTMLDPARTPRGPVVRRILALTALNPPLLLRTAL